MIAGRPFGFLLALAGGWTALRVVVVWYDTGSLPQAIRELNPVVRAQAADAVPAAMQPAMAQGPPRATILAVPARPLVPVAAVAVAARRAALSAAPPADAAVTPAAEPAPDPAGVLVPPPRAVPAPRRWRVSAWSIARGGAGLGAGPDAPQLGGAQAGVRVDRMLGATLAATARVATPFEGGGREVAVGLAWMPARVPVRVVIERRFGIDGLRGGPAVGIAGGVSDVRLARGLRLEGYGQAGAVWRGRSEPYADGAVRVAGRVGSVGHATIDAGIGAWGGAQRGVARVDTGPSVGVRVPVGGGAIRGSIDWRHRIAGNARPGSGLALTLGADF